jgi:threonine synthase
MKFTGRWVSHLESAIDGTILDADSIQTIHNGRPILVRYRLDEIAGCVDRDAFSSRPPDMYRFRELLPVGVEISPVSMGENETPLLRCPRLGEQMGLENLFIKDESHLPTGSFKSRGLSMAITMAKHFGVRRVAIPTAGNAGGAMAAYAARCGMEAWVFMPSDTPIVNQVECVLFNAQVILVDGLINDCGKIVREGTSLAGWFDMSTLREPYRIEGKKTMGLELAAQSDWHLPDVIIYPTGGGTGLIGMWKAFRELRQLGWLNSPTMPRMVAVQSDGCCPIVRAFEANARFAEPFAKAHTMASGLRVPVALGDFLILDAVRESQGCAVAVPESKIGAWQRMATGLEGISLCPETGACIGALASLLEQGWIKRNEKVLVFNTGAAQKYFEKPPDGLLRLKPGSEIPWETILATKSER